MRISCPFESLEELKEELGHHFAYDSEELVTTSWMNVMRVLKNVRPWTETSCCIESRVGNNLLALNDLFSSTKVKDPEFDTAMIAAKANARLSKEGMSVCEHAVSNTLIKYRIPRRQNEGHTYFRPSNKELAISIGSARELYDGVA